MKTRERCSTINTQKSCRNLFRGGVIWCHVCVIAEFICVEFKWGWFFMKILLACLFSFREKYNRQRKKKLERKMQSPAATIVVLGLPSACLNLNFCIIIVLALILLLT